MTFLATSGVREIDLMTASLPRSMRRAISTSPSRVSSGTVPISRRYMRTGSLVLSSAPGVRSSSSSSAPSAVRSIGFVVAQVFLVGVDDLDAGAAERVEQVVELVGRGDVRRQQLVDLVVEQVALLLADVDQLPDFVVFFFDRQVRLHQGGLAPPASVFGFNLQSDAEDLSSAAKARQFRVRAGRRPAPAAGRFRAEWPRARGPTAAA